MFAEKIALFKSLFWSFPLEKVTADWTVLALDPEKIDLIIFSDYFYAPLKD